MPEREREFRRTWIWRDPPGHRTCRFGQTWEGLWSPSRVWWESTGGFLWVYRMNWLTLGMTPWMLHEERWGWPSVGEERPVWRLLKSSRWGVMAMYTRVVGVEVMRSLWGYIFTTEPRGCADGLDEWCEKKIGIKDSPWCWARAIVQMVVPFTEMGNTREEKV